MLQQVRTSSPKSRFRVMALALVAAILVGAIGGWVLMHNTTAPASERTAKVPEKTELPPSHELVRDGDGHPVRPAALRISDEAAATLNIIPGKTVLAVREAKEPRALPPLDGNLAYENDSLFAVRTRFAGEVVEIGPTPSTHPEADTNPALKSLTWGGEPRRSLAAGDRIKTGELMAVIWSKDLGTQKAALVDALCALRLSKNQLERYAKLYEDGALPLAVYKQQERQVQADGGAVLTAKRTLKIWRLTDDEIRVIEGEANKIIDLKQVRDPDYEKKWARVEIRAPHDGIIVEKNTNVGDWVDPSKDTPMFRIADLRTLAVWAHPLEEYLPAVRQAMAYAGPEGLRWKVRLQAEKTTLEGPVLRIAPSIDPMQHTMLVMGRVDNPEGRLLVGQFVTATIYVRPRENLVEIPTTALNEENGQSLVFVQPDPQRLEFVLRRVGVADRFKDVVFLRSKLSEQDERESKSDLQRGQRPIQPLQPGERVVTQGVPMLTVALRDLLAKENSKVVD